MTIVPDAKDWTWVLQRPCPECGLDTQGFPRADLPAMIRACGERWRLLLAAPGGHRTRPEPGTWSALEYGCHVRDVFRLYDTRLTLMLTQDGPRYPNWDQNLTAIEDGYAAQDPAAVAAELAAAAEVIAARFGQVSGDQWLRPGFRSDGAEFTIESFGRYFIHDPLHHYYDVAGTTT